MKSVTESITQIETAIATLNSYGSLDSKQSSLLNTISDCVKTIKNDVATLGDPTIESKIAQIKDSDMDSMLDDIDSKNNNDLSSLPIKIKQFVTEPVSLHMHIFQYLAILA